MSWNSSASNLVDVAPFCATGNCTWTPYTSLGVCHSLANVSDYLTSTLPNQGVAYSTSLPGGQYFSAFASPTPGEALVNITPTDFTNEQGANSPLSFPKSIAFVGTESPLAHGFIFYTNANPPQQPGNYTGYIGFTAVEYVLHWCVQT